MRYTLSTIVFIALASIGLAADPLPVVDDVEGQPLGQNADRIAKALDFLGRSLPADVLVRGADGCPSGPGFSGIRTASS